MVTAARKRALDAFVAESRNEKAAAEHRRIVEGVKGWPPKARLYPQLAARLAAQSAAQPPDSSAGPTGGEAA